MKKNILSLIICFVLSFLITFGLPLVFNNEKIDALNYTTQSIIRVSNSAGIEFVDTIGLVGAQLSKYTDVKVSEATTSLNIQVQKYTFNDETKEYVADGQPYAAWTYSPVSE